MRAVVWAAVSSKPQLKGGSNEEQIKAGGVVLGMPSPMPAATPSTDPMATLTKLRSLFDAGLITEGDYEKKKAEILATL